MPQFTLYHNNNRQTHGRYPFLLDIQNDFLQELKTRLVVPVMELTGKKPITRLNPVFEWQQKSYLLIVQEMAAIPAGQLGDKVTQLENMRGEILAALDLMITGI